MTTRQFTSFFAALSMWIIMIYYALLANSPFSIDQIDPSPAWYWCMFFLGSITAWIFIDDVRQSR